MADNEKCILVAKADWDAKDKRIAELEKELAKHDITFVFNTHIVESEYYMGRPDVEFFIRISSNQLIQEIAEGETIRKKLFQIGRLVASEAERQLRKDGVVDRLIKDRIDSLYVSERYESKKSPYYKKEYAEQMKDTRKRSILWKFRKFFGFSGKEYDL